MRHVVRLSDIRDGLSDEIHKPHHFDSEGKVAGGHAYFDAYGLAVQLGFAEPM